MDILENVNTNISSMVTSSFDEFISTKVKEEVEKEKDKFLKDLNMCEEEYPVFDESKHTKFEACKLVNDNSLPYQTEPRKTHIINNNEYILKNIRIKNCSVNIPESHKNEYFITNKGNIYVKPFSDCLKTNTHRHILFNYKVLEYLNPPGCAGQALKREIVNSGWVISGEMSNNDVVKNCPASYDPKWVISLSDAVGGCGCGYNSFGNDTELSREAPRLRGTDYQSLRDPGLYCHYEDHVGWMEDCIDRFMNNNICPDCGSGEVIPEKLDTDINIEIFRNPPIFNNEYIELLELLSKKGVTIPIYQIQTIYAKYHPRANENFVIDGKLKTLEEKERRLEEKENRVEEKILQTKMKRDRSIEFHEAKSRQIRKELEKELDPRKKELDAKVKEINDEKLKNIFSMFILINEKKNNDDDKKTIREMINHTKERCNQKETDFNAKLQKEKDDFEKEKAEYRKKVSELIDIANDINELNEEQDDTSCKSNDIFNIIKRLKYYK